MSRMMNAGPPEPGPLLQARTGDRPWPGEPGWHRQAGRGTAAVPDIPRQAAGGHTDPVAAPGHQKPGQPEPGQPEPGQLQARQPGARHRDAGHREPTLVLDVDLREPLPDVAGGTVTRVWLMLRLGGAAVGDLLLDVPQEGLCGAGLGAVIAARIGARRRPERARSDSQPRSRRRGSTSSL
jgi:hypothetical protein